MCTKPGPAAGIAESGAAERCVRGEVEESHEASEEYQGVCKRRMVTVSWRWDYCLRGRITTEMYNNQLHWVVAFGKRWARELCKEHDTLELRTEQYLHSQTQPSGTVILILMMASVGSLSFLSP